MKKVLSFSLAGLLLAAGAAAQNRVDYLTLRSFGDTINSPVGAVWSIGALSPVNHPTCLANGRLTVRGAAYVGQIAVPGVLPPTADERDQFIHDTGALLVFDAAALQASAPNGQYDLVLDNLVNLGLGGMLQVSVIDDAVVRTVLQRGPFPANFAWIFDTTISANGDSVAYSKPVRFVPAIQDHRISLSSGSSATLNVCLGPTGQVRMIDDGNNGDWASACVAGGWRAESIAVGGGSKFADAVEAALSNPPLTTYPLSCTAPATVAMTQVGGAIVVDNPIVVSVTMVDSAYESDRAEEILYITGLFGGDNLLILAGDPDFPTAEAWIEGS